METFSSLLAFFVQGIHRSPVNSPHKGQRRGALMFSLICARTNSCAYNGDAGDLRCHRTYYEVIVMYRGISIRWVHFRDVIMLRVKFRSTCVKLLSDKCHETALRWILKNPWLQGSWGQHGAHLRPTGPSWAPCWSHELCYLRYLWW